MDIAQYIIYAHAVLGGLALLSGSIALSVKKGSMLHKKTGKIFFFAMLLSVLISIIVSWIPGHTSFFLFIIGLFSIYLILSGFFALKLKKVKRTEDIPLIHKLITIGMVIAIIMLLYPVYIYFVKDKIHFISPIFGGVALFLIWVDLQTYRNIGSEKGAWLRLHLTKMTGAYIASTTAFLVVNNVFPPFGWFIPSILGTIYIAYWTRKMS